MGKHRSNFWVGVAVGALGGVWAARKLLEPAQMPNAKAWQRILAAKRGQLEAAIFMARVRGRYSELKARRPVFDKTVFNFHVVGGMLPGLALYQTLREDGMDETSALAEIDDIFETWFDQVPPLNVRLNQIMAYTPENFALFRRLVSFIMDTIFPAPGWQYEMVDADENTLAFNIHHCFYIEVLKYYGAPELTPVFCKLDDYLMAAMPASIKWGRTQTIGMGAEYCDFRWDFVPVEKVGVG